MNSTIFCLLFCLLSLGVARCADSVSNALIKDVFDALRATPEQDGFLQVEASAGSVSNSAWQSVVFESSTKDLRDILSLYLTNLEQNLRKSGVSIGGPKRDGKGLGFQGILVESKDRLASGTISIYAFEVSSTKLGIVVAVSASAN